MRHAGLTIDVNLLVREASFPLFAGPLHLVLEGLEPVSLESLFIHVVLGLNLRGLGHGGRVGVLQRVPALLRDSLADVLRVLLLHDGRQPFSAAAESKKGAGGRGNEGRTEPGAEDVV